MNSSLINAIEQAARPLCRSYVFTRFDALKVRVQGEAGEHAEPLRWAVGVLSDNAPDFLGCWRDTGPAAALWQHIADDLKVRGVERIRFAMGAEPPAIEAAMASRFRDFTVLPLPSKPRDPSMLEALLPGHRPYFERAEDVVNGLAGRLRRAVARQGPFASFVEACAFLQQKADRYIDTAWPEPEAPLYEPARGAAKRHVPAAGV